MLHNRSFRLGLLAALFLRGACRASPCQFRWKSSLGGAA
jgi:hypothetical protein